MTLTQRVQNLAFLSTMGLAGIGAGCSTTPPQETPATRRAEVTLPVAETARKEEVYEVPQEVIHLYDKRFSPEAVKALHKNSITPDIANKYAPRFNQPAAVIALYKASIPLEKALQYDNSFDATDIVDLYQAKITPKDASKYAQLNRQYRVKLSGKDICWIANEGIFYDTVKQKARECALEEVLKK